MKNKVFTTVISLTILSGLTPNLNAYAADNTNLQQAQREHPNADFSVNPHDGSFTYSLNETPKNNHQQTPSDTPRNNNRIQNNRQQEPANNALHNNSDNASNHNHRNINNTYNSNNNYNSNIPTGNRPISDTRNNSNNNSSETEDNTTTNSQVQGQNRSQTQDQKVEESTRSDEERSKSKSEETKDMLNRDLSGFVNKIDVDKVSHRLSLENFNKEAKTEDGKPLAMDNGKIIDHPQFSIKNNLYTSGQCTYYVFDKRAADGNTISTFWGDAKNWASQASSSGFKVDHKPAKGAIFQTTSGFYGHVAYVENVNSNGSVRISEMNYIAPYIVSSRTIPASEAANYNYIH